MFPVEGKIKRGTVRAVITLYVCTSVCIPLGRVSIPLQRQLCAITSIAGEELEKDRAHTTGAMRGVYEPVCCYISQTKEIQTRGYTSLSI